MSFNRGFLNKRIWIWNPVRTASEYGGTTVQYQKKKKIWANVEHTRGTRAMRNGQIDAYYVKMVRCDIHEELTEKSRLEIDGKYYVITAPEFDKDQNKTQLLIEQIEDINKVITQG